MKQCFILHRYHTLISGTHCDDENTGYATKMTWKKTPNVKNPGWEPRKKFCGSRIPGTLEKAVVVVSCSVAFGVGDGVADEEQPIPKTMSIVDKPIIQNLFSQYLAFKLNPPD